MVTTVGLELRDVDNVRPELPIPLAPVVGPARLLRRTVTGLREPSFEYARTVTLRWVAGAAGVLVLGGTIIAAGYARFVLGLGIAMAGYAVARVLALALFERRQRAFESGWLRAQSEKLRTHAFDVVRFSLEVDSRRPGSDLLHLDLTRPEEVGWLIRRQATERDRRQRSRAHIEFVYWPDSAGNPSIERVRRELADIEVHPVAAVGPAARIRFPEASYGSQPAVSGGDHRLPGRRTY